jgi:hypothetical protein
MIRFRFWRSVEDAASAEAWASPQPGYYDGPADAYRHIVGTAEARRRYGFGTAYALATANEMLGTHADGHPPAPRQMDDHNNAIGFSIGADAKSYEEVVQRARAAIDAAIARGGDGSDGTPRWLETWSEPRRRPAGERALPVQWPDAIPSARKYPFGAEQFSANRPAHTMTPRQREAATLERLSELPTSEWSEADVRAVIGSRHYTNSSAPEHRAWRAHVQQYFEERTRRSGTGDDTSQTEEKACGGVASVRAYTRAGPSGTVQVSAHSRTVSCG